MNIHGIDIAIIAGYIVVVVIAGLWLSKLAGKNIESYFLGGKRIPWYLLGIANASGMFDITGTMWLVTVFFIYGLKSIWLPWVWPTFNQIFLMIYLSIWIRRSKVMTGAEWIRKRFGHDLGAELSHISVIVFAMFMVISMLAYAFRGVGAFAQIILPWELPPEAYATILMLITAIYVMFGGMYSVVLTDIIQFTLMTIASVFIAIIAIRRVSPELLASVVPDGWFNLSFGWKVNLDWSALVATVNDKIATDGFNLFTIFFMMTVLKGVLASMAGPTPNFDMQKILSARTPKEAAMMSWCVSFVLNVPRYLMIAGVAILGLAFFSGELNTMAEAGQKIDFEQILPWVIKGFLPVGLIGIVLAGLFAAFMSTFDATVNCGASYLVNDVYKRYIKPNAKPRTYVIASYICTVLIVGVGLLFGFFAESIQTVTQWVVTGLFGGYTAPNVLKWHWWRFNGFGYFAGMISGLLTATAFAVYFSLMGQDTVPMFSGNLERNLAVFPIILVVSTLFSIIVSLLTKPEDENTIKDFYKSVRPWGFWGPIRELVSAEDPNFKPNTAFSRDMLNVVIGTIWQTTFVLIPVYLVVRKFRAMVVSIVIMAATSVFLKFNWYDKLEND